MVRAGFCLAVLAVFVRLVFWGYTGRYWEDALIACLHSENFVRGLGLSPYRPGDGPIQAFSSPLLILIALIGDHIRLGWGIETVKLASALAAFFTIRYALGICLHPSVSFPRPLTMLVLGYLAFEYHQILFAMSGMETQLAAGVLLASAYYFCGVETPEAGRGSRVVHVDPSGFRFLDRACGCGHSLARTEAFFARGRGRHGPVRPLAPFQ